MTFNFQYISIIVLFANLVFLNIVCYYVCFFLCKMDTYSSAESSKPHSTHKAYVLNELKEAKQALALKDEAMKRLEERLAKVELKQERSSHSIHGKHHSSRHSSNAHDHGKDYRRRRHHHHSHGESHHREQRHHQEAKP